MCYVRNLTARTSDLYIIYYIIYIYACAYRLYNTVYTHTHVCIYIRIYLCNTHERTLRSRSSTLCRSVRRRNAASNLLLKYANMTSYFAQVSAHEYMRIVAGSDKDARRGFTRVCVCVCVCAHSCVCMRMCACACVRLQYYIIFVRGASRVRCRVVAFAGEGCRVSACVIYIFIRGTVAGSIEERVVKVFSPPLPPRKLTADNTTYVWCNSLCA